MTHERRKTKDRILALLCGVTRSVEELAEALGISGSAVRVHLEGLETDGLVDYERQIRGVGKPVHRYRLTEAGLGFLSRAYLPLVDGLLSVLASRMTAEELESVLREAGKRMGEGIPAATGDEEARADALVRLVESLGGWVDVERTGQSLVLRGRCCPVAALAPKYPAVCAAVETLLASYGQLEVREGCQRNGTASCRFTVGLEG